MRRRAWALAVLLALGLLLVGCGSRRTPRPPPVSASPAAVPAPEPVVALNVQVPRPEYLPLLDELGVRHVRASFWWWSAPEEWAALPDYRAAGVEVLPIVYGNGAPDPESMALAIAGRHALLASVYGPFPFVQLDNEADGGGHYAQDGAAWGRVVRRAAELIHLDYPETRIVSAGLAWNREGVREWTRAMIREAGSALDVLALHVYGVGCAGEPLSRYKVLRELGWSGEVWATEVGVDDGQAAYIGAASDAFQADQLRACLFADPSRSGYARLYWFQLPSDPWGWGVLRADGSRRPAFDVLRARGG